MSLFTKPIETALKERDAAIQEAQDWEQKAAEARATADELEATATAEILKDEKAAERLSLEISTLQRKAKAFDQAAENARVSATHATLSVFIVEADELDKEATKQRKAADKVEAEVTALREKLEELDGCKYTRLVEESNWDAVDGKYRTRTYHHGKAHGIKHSAMLLTTQAQVIRYWMKNGQIPGSLRDLNEAFEPIHDVTGAWADGAPIDKYGDPITENLRVALAAAADNEGE